MTSWLLFVAQILPTIVALITQIQGQLEAGAAKKAAVTQTIEQLVASAPLPEADKRKATMAAVAMIDPLVSTLKATEWQEDVAEA